jgi:hypothetical protein
VLILTRNSILDVLGEVTVAPVTATIRTALSAPQMNQVKTALLFALGF